MGINRDVGSPGGNRKNLFESHAFAFKHHDLSDLYLLLCITTNTIFRLHAFEKDFGYVIIMEPGIKD